MTQNKYTSKQINLPELTTKLKKEDEKYATLSKRIQVIYWVLIPIYLIMIVVYIIDNAGINYIAGSVCFVVAMLIFALLFRNYQKEYNNVDYSEPTLIMLQKAAYRYKPFQLKTLWALLAIVIMDIGLSLSASEHMGFARIQFIFLGTISIAIIIGLIIWNYKYRPLRDKALKLINEINNS
jgi:small-conductance mechanosensitive channel